MLRSSPVFTHQILQATAAMISPKMSRIQNIVLRGCSHLGGLLWCSFPVEDSVSSCVLLLVLRRSLLPRPENLGPDRKKGELGEGTEDSVCVKGASMLFLYLRSLPPVVFYQQLTGSISK
ncbi:hypothetical protein [Murid betaherpesvirus 1]|uniref:Uncharacterized protein n=1 Tax=Murid herpesvirus 1 (strain Smith) TaxID=10367 RepID=D3XDU6_MUHVS|nr:hypothetical protein QKG64_gp112 [Murid betaherpesvirus 1]ADD10489.1 hypothetical protein [Murid betaherpesvirus 1]